MQSGLEARGIDGVYAAPRLLDAALARPRRGAVYGWIASSVSGGLLLAKT
jgi:hypothetical protein